MFSKKKTCVGLIISSHDIVAIEVSNNKNTPEVTNYSKIELEENVVESNCIVAQPDKFKEAIKALLKGAQQGAIKAKEVFLAIPEENTFSHQLSIPKKHINNVAYIKEEANDFIPIELDEAVFDFKVTDHKSETGKIQLKFIATQNIIVESLTKALKEIDIEVIKVDVDIDSLIRSFTSTLNKNEGDILLINIGKTKDLVAICDKDENAYRVISRKSEEGIQMSEIKERVEKLIQVASADKELEIKRVYLSGSAEEIAGIQEMLNSVLPGIEVKNGVEFAQIPKEIENEILIGIGICINLIQGNKKKDFNLLPENKKEELSIAPIIPKLYRILIIVMIILIFPLIRVSIESARNYIEYEVKTREVVILVEQSLNPYLTSIAKLKTERKQVQQQILAVLGDSIPVSELMKSIDKNNTDNVNLLNVSFRDGGQDSDSKIVLTAEVANRETTEELVEYLENESIYKEVNSPLSNLVGKGKRLVKIDLTVDEEELLKETDPEKENNE